MSPGYLQKIFTNDEDHRVAAILFRIIVALWVTFLALIGMALHWSAWNLMAVAIAACLLQLVPMGLLLRGHLQSSGLVVVLTVLVVVTIIATMGQGIHDFSIMAYPIIIVIASLLLKRRDFFRCSFLTLSALAWLVFGEAFGGFISKKYDTPTATDFIIVAVVLLVAIMAVDLLAENMRENMRQAQQEIARRKEIETLLRHQSIHDPLTGIYNRAFFEEELARLERSRDYPVSIIVADVDDLKIVNDTRGHAVGDEVLRGATAALCATFRASDILARIGGDEFAVLLPHTDAATAEHMLVRVHTLLDEHNARVPDLPVQLSLGTATAEKDQLVAAMIVADQHMYLDKALRKSKR